MSDNLKAGIRFTPDIYAEIGYDTQNETGEMSVIGANGETIWESGESGGGSSDLSIATLTINNVDGPDAKFDVALINARGWTGGGIPHAPLQGETETLNVILFKGLAVLNIENKPENLNISISGDIQNGGNNSYAITGDCTITLSEI